jgi:hypothetical protein
VLTVGHKTIVRVPKHQRLRITLATLAPDAQQGPLAPPLPRTSPAATTGQ